MPNPYTGNIAAVAGLAAFSAVTPTISLTTYSSGMCLGGLLTLTNAVQQDAGSAFLHNALIIDKSNQKPTGVILVWDQNPTLAAGGSATVTDHTAFAAGTSDFNVVNAISVGSADWVTVGTTAFASFPNLGRLEKPTSGTSVFAGFILNAALSTGFSGTNNQQVKFRFKFVPNIN